MARARSPNSIEAEKMYRSGMKLIEIAKKMGVPEGTVRRWKSTQKWENEGRNKSECSEKKGREKKASVRKPGPPKGNKNAEGFGAPQGNKNAEKHGAYSTIYLDALDDDEIALIQSVNNTEKEILIEQIGIYSVRERKLMHKIKEFEDNLAKGLYVKKVCTSKHSIYGKDPQKPEPESIDTNTKTEHWIKGLTALESELTKIQRAKTKCVDSLIRLRKLDEDYDNVINMRRAKQDNENVSNDSKDMEEIHVYIPDNGRDKP